MSALQQLRDLWSQHNVIRIRDATFQMLAAMLFRQVLLTGAGGLLTLGAMSHVWTYALAAVLLFVAVAAYGLVRGYIVQRDAKRMANALPDTLAVVVK